MAASMESRNQGPANDGRARRRRAAKFCRDGDFWAAGGWNFLALNLLLGVAVIPVAIWASRKYGDRLGRSWLMRRVAEEIAGRELRVAMDSLAKMSEFDRE